MGRQTVASVLLVLSVVINLVLAHKLREYDRLMGATRLEPLKPGVVVPPFHAGSLNGQQEAISYQGTERLTVLYVFTPTCVWCARNMDNLKTLLYKERDRYRFIGLSLSEQGLPEYVAKNDLKLPVYSGVSPEMLKTYKLGSTPQTIVISSEGKVLQDWAGAYVGDQKSQVEAFFNVTLPGLTPVPEPSVVSGAETSKNTANPQSK